MPRNDADGLGLAWALRWCSVKLWRNLRRSGAVVVWETRTIGGAIKTCGAITMCGAILWAQGNPRPMGTLFPYAYSYAYGKRVAPAAGRG